MAIGGNITARIEKVGKSEQNRIGEQEPTWSLVGDLRGWLDMLGSGTGPGYGTFNAAIAESTHLFLADYNAAIAAAKHETCRAIIDGQRYTVQLIDDPMGMHRQLEIYLQHVGGQ